MHKRVAAAAALKGGERGRNLKQIVLEHRRERKKELKPPEWNERNHLILNKGWTK